MKIIRCIYQGETITAVSKNGIKYVPVDRLGMDKADLFDLIHAYNTAGFSIEDFEKKLMEAEEEGFLLEEAKLLSPAERPVEGMIGVGLNFPGQDKEHINNVILFERRVNRFVDPDGAVNSHSDFVSKLDYEYELAVILGKDAYKVKAEDAESYIFGYSTANDMSAFDLKKHKQNFFMKALDDTTPFGPLVVTADEIAYPPELDITFRVNGELRQHGNTRDFVYDIGKVLETITQGVTLKAGTMLIMGSPFGQGNHMDPPQFLRPGDVVEGTIEGIGTIRNHMI